MKHIKRLFAIFDKFPLLIVVIVGILASRVLFMQNTYFIMHDDLQMMRQLEMEKCITGGQIPCRWVPDMAFGLGYPLFNYYPPLPYYVGEVFRIVRFPFTSTVMLTFATAFIASGIAMYFLAKKFFGKLGGILSASLYIWGPYHAVDIYVRGAMNESWAFVFFPLIFLFSYNIIVEKKYKHSDVIGLALSLFGLLTSHNLMVMIFAPFMALWIGVLLILKKQLRKIPILAVSSLWGLGLAAFFTIPVLLEQKYIQIENVVGGYYDYAGHFVSLKQLFLSRFWGDGPSVFGENDLMSFQIGHIHWVLASVSAVALVLYFLKTKKMTDATLIGLFSLFIAGVSAFMTHSRSHVIWETLPKLYFVQFPWRFLTIVVFGTSLAAGSIFLIIDKYFEQKKIVPRFMSHYFRSVFLFFILTLTCIFYWNYFKPVHYGPLTDEQKFTGEAWRIQQSAAVGDYLPKTSSEIPVGGFDTLVDVIEGEATIKKVDSGTNWHYVEVNVVSDKAQLRINTLDFPEWKIFSENQEIQKYIPEDEKWGRMYFDLSQGSHTVYTQFLNTPLRTASNLVSLVSWGGLAVFLFLKHKKARTIVGRGTK